MLGRLQVERGAWGAGTVETWYGLRVIRACTDPEGWLGRQRLLRAGRTLRRGGVVRLLAPRGFARWDVLRQLGLRPVDPTPFLQAQSVPLALGALERQGIAPDRATVSLRGPRAGLEMRRTAAELSRRVKSLSVWAPNGGEELADWLRWEYGIPVLPPDEEAQAVLRFSPDAVREEGRTLDLYGFAPDLSGLRIRAAALPEEDRDSLPLLTALWESGALAREGLEIS